MASQLLLFPNRQLVSGLDPHIEELHLTSFTLSSFTLSSFTYFQVTMSNRLNSSAGPSSFQCNVPQLKLTDQWMSLLDCIMRVTASW